MVQFSMPGTQNLFERRCGCCCVLPFGRPEDGCRFVHSLEIRYLDGLSNPQVDLPSPFVSARIRGSCTQLGAAVGCSACFGSKRRSCSVRLRPVRSSAELPLFP